MRKMRENGDILTIVNQHNDLGCLDFHYKTFRMYGRKKICQKVRVTVYFDVIVKMVDIARVGYCEINIRICFKLNFSVSNGSIPVSIYTILQRSFDDKINRLFVTAMINGCI